MLQKVAQTTGAFEQWAWPQAVTVVGVAAAVLGCVWVFFHYLSK